MCNVYIFYFIIFYFNKYMYAHMNTYINYTHVCACVRVCVVQLESVHSDDHLNVINEL